MGATGVAARPEERREGRREGRRIAWGRAANACGWLFGALVLVALLIAAAFQTHPAADLTIGDAAQDDALVRGFFAPERQLTSAGGRAFRWSGAESHADFPGIGRTAATVTLTLAGGANPNPDVRILANGGELTRLRLSPDFADYALPVPAPYLVTGNLTLTLEAATFRNPGDRRDLGVLVGRVRVQPEGGLAPPPARPALALWGVVALLTLALVVVGLSGREAAIAAVAMAVALAAGLALAGLRFFVTVAADEWLSVAAATLLLAAALRLLAPPIFRRLAAGGQPPPPHPARATMGGDSALAPLVAGRWLLAAILAVFAARMGGLWHPAMIVSDLRFHVHRFEDVLRGQWLLSIPAIYDGGRPTPYPPAVYALFAPFARLVPDHETLLTVGTQLLDALRLLITGAVAWRMTGSRVAGACAALIAGAVPVAFLLFSWGNLTDAAGEVALTGVFALLALALPRLWEPRYALTFVSVALFALLAHIGVAVTTLALIGVTVATIALRLLWRERTLMVLRELGPPVLLTVATGLLAVALYYRMPLTDPRIAAAESPYAAELDLRVFTGYVIGAPRPDATVGLPAIRTESPVVAVVGQLALESWAYFRLWPVLLAPAGVWLLRRHIGGWQAVAAGDDGETPVFAARYAPLVVVGWLLGTLALLAVGVLSGRFVRHAVSAIPAVAVGASAVLAYVWRWRWGRVAVVALLAATTAATLLIWYGRITRTYHG